MGKEKRKYSKETEAKVDAVIMKRFEPIPYTGEEVEEAVRLANAALETPHTIPIPTTAGALYALATTLASAATEENFANVAVYLQRIHLAGYSEFAVLALRDAVQANRALVNTKVFVELLTGSGAYGGLLDGTLGELIGGANDYEPPTQTGSGV